MDLEELVGNLELTMGAVKGNLRRIADIHVAFYRFYIRFASRCEALVFDKKSRDYLEKCIEFLLTKKLTTKALNQSRANLLKMLESLYDLCVSLGGDKMMLTKIHSLVDQAVGDEVSEAAAASESGGALDLLKQLKNLLNDPDEDMDTSGAVEDNRCPSPANSLASSNPEQEESRERGGIEPMTKYLLSDSGMDSYYSNYSKDIENIAITCEMNNVMSKAFSLRENKYTGLDNMVAKMKINVPIWNYNIDRVDTMDTNNVIENMKIFQGTSSVTNAVLYSCPDFFNVGPFEVYVRNKVFVYHCLVNKCNDCMTTSLEFLKLHVKFTHGESEIDWNCSACELINMHSASQRSLDGALDHLAKCHSMKTTYTLSKERLMEINKNISENSNNVTGCPEIKDEETKEDLNLFQCPTPTCMFSTNSLTAAFGHFSSITTSELLFKCLYCPFISFSNYLYCDHVIKSHGYAKYKCSYCPYRSVSKANLVFHQRDSHAGKPHAILGFDAGNLAEYKYDCRAHNSIKAFMCYESCEFSTLIEQKFNSHLLDHAGVTIICRYCSKYENCDIGELRDHLLIHGVGEYHCLYCNEAFNFILKAERHLHQIHPSKYPFIVICQDYENRSHSLKGKYNKIHKLEIGSESIIVVALESDKNVVSVQVVDSSESITIEDIDHCKMQLKFFLKNVYEELPESVGSHVESPKVVETLDLTQSDDPRERVDIKPRIRVKNIEQLQSNWLYENAEEETAVTPLPEVLQSSSLVGASLQELPSPFNFEHNSLIPSHVAEIEMEVPILTPSRIKQEKVTGGEVDPTSTLLYSNNKTPTSKQISPMKTVRVKQEGQESLHRELMIEEEPISQQSDTWNDDNSVAEGTVQQEAWDQEGNIAAAAIMEVDNTPANEFEAVPATHDEIAEGRNENSINSFETSREITNPVADLREQNASGPILNETSIADMPVDFDCDVIQQSEAVDQKVVLNPDGSVVLPAVRYIEPTVVDTVIISDGEGDEDYSLSSSPGPSTSSISNQVATMNKSDIMEISENQTVVPQTSSTKLVVSNVARVIQTEIRKFRCKLCLFSSEDRQTTLNHLYSTHTRNVDINKSKTSLISPAIDNGGIFVLSVSCPYCSKRNYEGIKSFERHHATSHGDFSETKCFINFPSNVKPPEKIFSCSLCGTFCRDEDGILQHNFAVHFKNSRPYNETCVTAVVAFKKIVCPLYNCLEEFLQPEKFQLHMKSHKNFIACKTCTYTVDDIENFHEFHKRYDAVERLTHFSYYKTREETCAVERFSNLYSLNNVLLGDIPPKKLTARKSTGAQYKK